MHTLLFFVKSDLCNVVLKIIIVLTIILFKTLIPIYFSSFIQKVAVGIRLRYKKKRAKMTVHIDAVLQLITGWKYSQSQIVQTMLYRATFS